MFDPSLSRRPRRGHVAYLDMRCCDARGQDPLSNDFPLAMVATLLFYLGVHRTRGGLSPKARYAKPWNTLLFSLSMDPITQL